MVVKEKYNIFLWKLILASIHAYKVNVGLPWFVMEVGANIVRGEASESGRQFDTDEALKTEF